jgi:hypothetical protein
VVFHYADEGIQLLAMACLVGRVEILPMTLFFGSGSMAIMNERSKWMCDFLSFHFICLYQAHNALLGFFDAGVTTLSLSTVAQKGGPEGAGRSKDEEERPPPP